jgi:hypothetical protein
MLSQLYPLQRRGKMVFYNQLTMDTQGEKSFQHKTEKGEKDGHRRKEMKDSEKKTRGLSLTRKKRTSD